MSEEIVIAWDENEYADLLREELGDRGRVVVSESELHDAMGREPDRDSQDWNDVRLVLLLELAWEEQRSRFCGFDIARNLLLDGFDQPIVFCSFMAMEQLYYIQKVGRRLARMPFPSVRLPADPGKVTNRANAADALTGMGLTYIRDNFLSKRAKAIVAHDIDGALEKTKSELPELQDAVRPILEDFDAYEVALSPEIMEQRRVVGDALEGEDYNEARSQLLQFVRLLDRDHHLENDEDSQDTEKFGYSVILLEDEPEELEFYRKGLESHFDVFATRRAEEALRELRENPHGRDYMAVIADWRLLKKDGVTWQPMFGFDLLAEARKIDPSIYLASLTSLGETFVLSVLKHGPIKHTNWFPKGVVGRKEPWSFPEFANYIHEKVEPHFLVRKHLPDLGRWKKIPTAAKEKGGKTFRRLFLELRGSDEWHEAWEEIKKPVQDIVEQYVEEHRNRRPTSDIKDPPYELSKGGNRTPAGRERLIKMLKLRLIALALHFEHGFNDEEIYCLLNGVSEYFEEDNYWDREDTNDRSNIGLWWRDVGFSRSDKNIKLEYVMPHEREWLKEVYERDLDLSDKTGMSVEEVEHAREDFFREADYALSRHAKTAGIDIEATAKSDSIPEYVQALSDLADGVGGKKQKKNLKKDLPDIGSNRVLLRAKDCYDEMTEIIDSLE
jgi:hypothetical protein